MKQLLLILLVGLLFSSCTKTGVAPVKTYTSIEGTWSITESTLGYNATFDVVKGDDKYPYYVHNITGQYNKVKYTYTTAIQGIIALPGSEYNILLPSNGGMVALAGVSVNATFTTMTANVGSIQSGTVVTNFPPPITLNRVR